MDATASSKPQPMDWNQTMEVRFVSKHHGANAKNIEDLFWSDIASIGTEVIKRNGDSGGISRSRLAQVLDSNKLGAEEEMVAGSLYNNFNMVALSTPLKIGEKRITESNLKDLAKKFALVDRNFVKADKLTFWADDQGNLKRLSSDKSGSVRSSDLEKAQKSNQFSVADQAMISELRANFNSIAVDGKIGKAEIDQYWRNTKHAPGYSDMVKFYHNMHAIEANQTNPIAHKLYANEKSPLESIVPDAVQQRYAGDCTFLASLASLSEARPKDVLTLIGKNRSGLQVKFPILKNPIAVSPPTSYELGLYMGEKTNYGYWPKVMTNAFGVLFHDHVANPIEKLQMNHETKSEWAAHNTAASIAIEALTGHDTNALVTDNLSTEILDSTITKAHNDHRIMVLISLKGDDKTPDGFLRSHAFSILGVTKTKAGESMITVRDPANQGVGSKRGTIAIPISSLKRNFSLLIEETQRKAPEIRS